MTRAHDAPPAARAVFRRLLPGARGREVLRDLDREYAAVRERRSRAGADVWYVAQLLRPDTWRLAFALRRLARAAASAGTLPAARGDVRGFRSDGGRAWLSGLSLDLRLAWRMLLKSPGLTVVGVLGIAIGTALGVGAFVVLTGLVYPKLPLDEGERVVALTMLDAESGSAERQLVHEFVTWREELRSVEHVAAATMGMRGLVTGDAPAMGVRAAEMTASAFRVARVQPLIGRYLLPEDEHEAAPRVVVIGYELWQSRFEGDPAVVGRTVLVGGVPHDVVGVMPPGFAMPREQELWTPLRVDPGQYARGAGPILYVFGRLAPGVTRERAQAELTVLGRRAAAAFPETDAHLRPLVLPYTYPLDGIEDRGDLWNAAMMQLILSLLLIAIAVNVAVLVYARTAMRRSEIAVRVALGASRRRIITQLFIEALALSSVGAALGLAIAHTALEQFGALTAARGESAFWVDYGLQPRSVLFAAALAVLSACIVGVVPALKATGRRVQSDLRGLSGATARLGRGWTALIVVQVGVAVTVLPPALSQGYRDIRTADVRPTFAAHEFLTADLAVATPLDPGMDGVAHRAAAAARLALRLSELERRLEAEPALAGVTFEGDAVSGGARVELENASGGAVFATPDAQLTGVAPDYFEVLDVPLMAGRGLTTVDAGADAGTIAGETARAPGVGVVVNEAFVRQLLDGGNALGRRLRFVPPPESGAWSDEHVAAEAGPWHEVVGVVPNLHASSFDSTYATPSVYYAVTPELQTATLLVRVRGDDVDAFAPRLREIASTLDPDLRIDRVANLARLPNTRFLAMVAILLQLIFGIVVLLSAAGVHALMSVTVTRRRREIGVRAALGAQPHRLLMSVFSRAGAQLAFGALVGAALAAALLQGSGLGLIRNAGFVGLVVGVMMLAGLIAATGPALRGLRIHPMEALRDE
ncbi:MAG TPA: ABC transporter permease [Longimicrobiales bacterium]|nr:ABC transporter permease [Longimicrobiales bacterium]